MTMTNDQMKAFTEMHVAKTESFIEELKAELDSTNASMYVVVMGSGLPLNWATSKAGLLTKAEQAGTMYGTLEADKARAQRVANNVQCGKGKNGEVITYRELIERTIASQKESMESWKKMVDEMEA